MRTAEFDLIQENVGTEAFGSPAEPFDLVFKIGRFRSDDLRHNAGKCILLLTSRTRPLFNVLHAAPNLEGLRLNGHSLAPQDVPLVCVLCPTTRTAIGHAFFDHSPHRDFLFRTTVFQTQVYNK